MKNLPLVQIPYAALNPRFVPVLVDGFVTNKDDLILPPTQLAAEVITLNLSDDTMRVQFVDQQYNPVRRKLETIAIDVPIAYFFAEFGITKKA
jgi:hypothetical protein